MVTKEEFLAYENVQKSGRYNMIMDAVSVMDETKLSKEKYLEIIKNYQMYADKYLKKNG